MRTWQEIFRDRMGFPDSEAGPYVSELRAYIREQVEVHGMSVHSYGTWVGTPTHEERAKALLATIWEIEQGHHHRIENMDGWSWPRMLFRRREYRRAAKAAWAIPVDWVRAHTCHIRVFWHRRGLRRHNPYTR